VINLLASSLQYRSSLESLGLRLEAGGSIGNNNVWMENRFTFYEARTATKFK
jgi:hypothetical protein